MTNADKPDITARLDDIDERLEQLGDELDLIRTIQNGMRREVRTNSQTTARLERTVTQLADISRLHQQALRSADRDRQVFQSEIRRIWEYLLRQGGNGNTPPNN
jgi:predicted  nucleic acid-binding Zn-ribbon protein